MTILKNILSAFALFSLLAIPSLQAQAAISDNLTDEQKAELETKSEEAQIKADEAKDKAWESGKSLAEEQEITFEQFQSQVLKIVSLAIDRVNAAKNSINNNYYLSEDTKSELTDGLTALSGILSTYYTNVNNASSVEEIRALNENLIVTLKENTDVIVAAIQDSVLEVMAEILQAMEELQDAVNTALTKLANDCESAETEISELETLLGQLQGLEQDLKTAIEEEDVEAAKTAAKAALELSPEIAKQLKEVVNLCEAYL